MCLLSVGLETLGLLLRVWLWISVPIGVIILLVGTWLNYLRTARSKVGLRLAVEGLRGGVRPGDGESGGEGEVSSEAGELVGEGQNSSEVGELDGEQENSRGFGELGGAGAESGDESDREELTATGKETIYQGILWMKEKYERYREQADQRYELLREEFGRSERRYQELMAIMEQDKNRVLGDHLAEAQGQLNAKQEVIEEKQGIIEDLEVQLRSERLKVEELIKKLQANSELILRIYRELESIPDLGK
jgi:hypothetical protein